MSDEPVNETSSGLWRTLRNLVSRRGDSSLRQSLEETIDEYNGSEAASALGEGERRMLFNILEYGELRVDDVMVPRADIVAVDITMRFEDLLKLVADAAHSRMPLYRDSLDMVVGMIHVKDVIKAVAEGASDDFNLADLQRPVIFVPASMRIRDLLSKMRVRRIHMAIVVDEYGGTDGLVTIEDVVEQIVGEIEDEHDEDDEPVLIPGEGGCHDADARVEIEALEALLGVDLRDSDEMEDVDTLGGLVFALAGRVPEIGETIRHGAGYEFEVVDADPRRIHKIRVHPPRLHSDPGHNNDSEEHAGAASVGHDT